MPCTDAIGGELADDRLDVGLRRGLRQLDALRDHPGLVRLLLLHAHVDLGRLVDADQHRRQAHRRRTERLDLAAQAHDRLVPQTIAVHQDRTAGRALEVLAHDRPTISPFSSKSMIDAAGVAPSPGIVRISPQIG